MVCYVVQVGGVSWGRCWVKAGPGIAIVARELEAPNHKPAETADKPPPRYGEPWMSQPPG